MGWGWGGILDDAISEPSASVLRKNQYHRESTEDVLIHAPVSGERCWPFLVTLHILKQQGGGLMGMDESDHSLPYRCQRVGLVCVQERETLRSPPPCDSAFSNVVSAKAAAHTTMVWKGIE